MHASMRASFHFLPSDLTEQRVSGFEQLLLLWEWVGPCLLQLIGIRAGPLHGRGKRNWEAILAEFFEGDLGDLGERMALEDVYYARADSEQEGGRPLYSSSARGTFCLAGRALKAARRTWLPACRISMLLRGLGNSANRTDTSRADSASRGAAFFGRRAVSGCSRAAFEVPHASLLTWRPGTAQPRAEISCSSPTFVAWRAALEEP